mmetsp:Transcript_1669/g.2643  ORF Transcript_1669/g.2643 Transcript_1669/m.2643 type:complete len:290 (+) Transcript_1669:138-1007(+)|eukprot:CAMPEP_0185028424 /NCGR_PEP_ID=MMETSP1103-20130426/14114_1 /TAXON_ID=36769 /ORGANISM="Paraphysomonas bandaiensis, Strain Caron Lab Isolate" /LENGTH=289 /DNA_ID=CAMNT_0027562837 /DNA_START=87 /DNA_END=956 /DNA_ORIENTATION=-
MKEAQSAVGTKDRGVKIKIGIQSSSVSQSGAHGGTADKNSDSVPPIITVDSEFSEASIFDLCNVTEGRRGKKRMEPSDDDSVTPPSASRSGKSNTNTKVPRSSKRDDTATSTQASGPQVEIVNGKIVLKESSLNAPSLSSTTHDDFEEVEEGIHPTAKYSSFVPSRHSAIWGIEETKRFYEALRQCGTDFSLMQVFFPRRTRKQLKNKFSREERHHPELIKATLTLQQPLDVSPFEVHLGKIEVTDSKDIADGTDPVETPLPPPKQNNEDNEVLYDNGTNDDDETIYEV